MDDRRFYWNTTTAKILSPMRLCSGNQIRMNKIFVIIYIHTMVTFRVTCWLSYDRVIPAWMTICFLNPGGSCLNHQQIDLPLVLISNVQRVNPVQSEKVCALYTSQLTLPFLNSIFIFDMCLWGELFVQSILLDLVRENHRQIELPNCPISNVPLFHPGQNEMIWVLCTS